MASSDKTQAELPELLRQPLEDGKLTLCRAAPRHGPRTHSAGIPRRSLPLAPKRASPPGDSAHDGLPNGWERAHGLDPNNTGDGAAQAANGCTYVENYLNVRAGDPVP